MSRCKECGFRIRGKNHDAYCKRKKRPARKNRIKLENKPFEKISKK